MVDIDKVKEVIDGLTEHKLTALAYTLKNSNQTRMYAVDKGLYYGPLSVEEALQTLIEYIEGVRDEKYGEKRGMVK